MATRLPPCGLTADHGRQEVNGQGTTGTRWSDADFDGMSWHDCRIHSLSLEQDGECQSDLVLDLDFILEWIKAPKNSFRFRVAPAVLRFQNVDSLRIQAFLHFKEEFLIYSIDRAANEDKAHPNCHWTITIQSYSQDDDNRIAFDATGFVQELTASPVVIDAQSFTRQQRDEMIRADSGG